MLRQKIYDDVWNPLGTALEATLADDGATLAVYEPSVIYDADPQILAGPYVYKMWYCSGTVGNNISYAESPDGVIWTRHGANPVENAHTRSFVFKDGATYIMYAHGAGGLTKLTSADGITWAVTDVGTLAPGGGADWDNALNNVTVWIEGATWYMLYEGNLGAAPYKVGLATSADNGATFTKYGSNPVITNGAGSVSPGWITKVGGMYYFWAHVAAAGMTPTDFAKYESTDLINWTRRPAGLDYWRTDMDESQNPNGQVADGHLVEANGTVRLFYSTCYWGVAPFNINSAIAYMSLATLAKSNGGISLSYFPNLLANPGFQRLGAGAPDVFEVWTETAGDGALVAAEGAGEFQSGGRAIKLTAGATFNTQALHTMVLVSGKTYRVSGWNRGDGVNKGRVRVYGPGADMLVDWDADPIGTASVTWTPFSVDFVSAGNANLYVYCPNVNGGISYFDNMSFRLVN